MATIREIRRRIRSIRNLAQVTRALEAVSASKARRAQEQVLATRAYAHRAWEVITNLAGEAAAEAELHPLLTVRSPVARVEVVLLSGDRGLCGPFNHNIVRATLGFVEALDLPVRYVTVGRRGRDMMWRMGAEIVATFQNLPAAPSFADVSPIARTVIQDFLTGQADEVYLAYTDFINILQQRPAIKRLLPLRPTEVDVQAMSEYVVDMRPARVAEYIYEPDRAAILDTVLPRFTELQVYQAVLESLASEHAARMVAMRNATENAEELVAGLTLMYNKARQQSITLELLDIAGGAEALAQAAVQPKV